MRRNSFRNLNSIRSDASDADMETSTLELKNLKEKYRIMEVDRHDYTVESQEQIRRQLREIDLLKSERIEMEKELFLAESDQNQKRDEYQQKKIEDLIDERELLSDQIDEEIQKKLRIESEIKFLLEKIHSEKKKIGGEEKISNFIKDTDKLRKTLDNRLHLATEKFNKICAENNKKRDVIENLRIDKSNYLSKFRRNEKALKDLKKEVARVTEASTAAYEARDESHNKMFLLKDKCEKDIQLFNADIRELQRIIDDDKKRREFMRAKEVTRTVTYHATKKEKETQREGDEKIDDFERAFSAIVDCSGKDDVNEVVTNFIRVEDLNFALFNLVNEQNNSIEQLGEEIRVIQANIKEYKDEDVKMQESRLKIVKEMEDELEQVEKDVEASEKVLMRVGKILGQLQLAAGSLFHKIIGSSTDQDELISRHQKQQLGEGVQVDDDNVMMFLGLIEQRANQLILSSAYVDSQQNFESYDPYETARKMVGKVPEEEVVGRLTVDPPSTGFDPSDKDPDLDDDEEQEQLHPLTSEELKMKVLASVEKKEAEASKSHGQSRYDVTTTTQIKRR